MKLCPEGWPFVFGGLAVALGFWFAGRAWHSPAFIFISGLGLLATAFCAYFFRDPARVLPTGQGFILSPAYGKVMEIVEGTDPISSEPVGIIRIFLSVFDAHLQVAPIDGQVTKVQYKAGKFLDARDPKAAFENEQNRIELTGEAKLAVTQVAGLIARRIVCQVREGQNVRAGDKIGLIRFGSQVDVVVPKNVTWRVKAGDRVTGGETVLAELKR
jgi:phosphatidylserine decarboxylase